MASSKKRCVVAIDLDGTIIPTLIDFEELRRRIRIMLGVDHPLRPLGESLASLNLNEEVVRRAWDLIEKEEIESIDRLNKDDVTVNVQAILNALEIVEKVVVVTMRSSRSTKPILDKIGLSSPSLNIITRDLHKSRKEQLLHISGKYKDSKLILIGDTSHDEQAARDVGAEFIRVESYKDLPSAINLAITLCSEYGGTR